MANRLATRNTQALIEYRQEFIAVVAGSILLTIIGETAYEALTSAGFWARPSIYWRAILFVLALGLLGQGTVWLANVLERRASRGHSTIRTEEDVNGSPALVVFVSDKVDGPHRGTVDRFIEKGTNDKDRLQRVYLIFSHQSEGVAKEFESILQEEDLAADRSGLEADFADLRSVRDAVLKAVRRAKSDLQMQTVTVDVTGGTGICTAGAVLARLEEDFDLTYMRRIPGRRLEDGVMQRVDVDWAGGGFFTQPNFTPVGAAGTATDQS